MQFPQVAESTARSEFRGYGARGITAAAVLLAAGALNLAAERPAEARGGGAWERLAGCESGGNWRIDTGNGFSGGLQLAHSTWHSFGGGAYAPTGGAGDPGPADPGGGTGAGPSGLGRVAGLLGLAGAQLDQRAPHSAEHHGPPPRTAAAHRALVPRPGPASAAP